jgi:hypothetical protein
VLLPLRLLHMYSQIAASQRALLIMQAYLIGIPIWWVLGIDFLAPHCFALLLLFVNANVHRRFTSVDLALTGVIITLAVSAYVVGFLLSSNTTRFVAALYNLSLWGVGLIFIQQVRHQLVQGEASRNALLHAGYCMFVIFVIVAVSTVGLAYTVHRFSLVVPSVFGVLGGNAVPDGAVLVKQATNLVFARPDWGLPGVPMPRLTIYGPYPAATGAIAAVGGTIALLYLHTVQRARAATIYAFESLIVLMLAFTLTRSILAGWLAGWVIANLAFGTAFRRIAGCGALIAALLFASFVDLSDAAQYREYSSESRFANYVRAINDTLAESPVLGLGVKPREVGNHIAIGSHSTAVSSFTKGGTLGFLIVFIFLVLIPLFRWMILLCLGNGSERYRLEDCRPNLRILLNVQIAIWVWLCFEDIDAPATAATLIFVAYSFVEVATRRTVQERPIQVWAI